MQELEADFGIKLFDRTNRGVIATIYGDALTKHARLILAQVKHAGEELSDLAAGQGGRVEVPLGGPEGIVNLLPKVFQAFFEDEEARTCSQCGTLHPGKGQAPEGWIEL